MSLCANVGVTIAGFRNEIENMDDFLNERENMVDFPNGRETIF